METFSVTSAPSEEVQQLSHSKRSSRFGGGGGKKHEKVSGGHLSYYRIFMLPADPLLKL